jgi:hypothetical protein
LKSLTVQPNLKHGELNWSEKRLNLSSLVRLLLEVQWLSLPL